MNASFTSSVYHPTILEDRKSTRLNSSHGYISYAVFCLKKRIFVFHREVKAGTARPGHIIGILMAKISFRTGGVLQRAIKKHPFPACVNGSADDAIDRA